MKPERYQQVGQLYHAALELETDERASFLDGACGDDDELRREVESLLLAREQADGFIAGKVAGVVAEMAAQQRNPSLIGRSISHYQVLSLLGAGGMGEVYLAQDTNLGRKVALKLLPPAFTRDQERVRRFEREARSASALNHPNILTIYEVGVVGETHFIATEFIDGQTLRERLRGGRLELSEALDIGAQIANALSAAHEAGIVHRDIKPENVMVRRDRLVKVLDFGLAKLSEQRLVEQSTVADGGIEDKAKVSTATGVVMGTVSYMSPEQARGQKVDRRTDIFSLGVVIYEMIAGRRPFEGATMSDVIAALLTAEPPPLRQHCAVATAELERVVGKCLAKDREARYQSAEELLAELNTLWPGSQEEKGAATRGTVGAGTRLALWRRPVIVAIAITLIVGLAWFLFWRRAPAVQPDQIKSLAVLPLENLSGDPAQEYFAYGMTDALIGDLAKIGALRVISRTSAMRYKGTKKPLPEIAGELNVDAVVEAQCNVQETA